MRAPDVNVLVYAHRVESPQHEEYAQWLIDLAEGDEPFGLSDSVAVAFVRVVTHPKLWHPPTDLDSAIAFVDALRRRRNCRLIAPGEGHWSIFAELCRNTRARGKLVADADHAALAIEHGCEWMSADGDFSRFPGLRWRHPLR